MDNKKGLKSKKLQKASVKSVPNDIEIENNNHADKGSNMKVGGPQQNQRETVYSNEFHESSMSFGLFGTGVRNVESSHPTNKKTSVEFSILCAMCNVRDNYKLYYNKTFYN